MKIVHVKWSDSVSMNNWNEKRDVRDFIKEDLHLIDTFGALIYESKQFICLAQSFGQVTISDIIKIPRKVVKEIIVLKTLKLNVNLED